MQWGELEKNSEINKWWGSGVGWGGVGGGSIFGTQE